jgi:hypothetical protein
MHSKLPRTELWSVPDTRDRDRFRLYWQPVADEPQVAATRPVDDVESSTVARVRIAA